MVFIDFIRPYFFVCISIILHLYTRHHLISLIIKLRGKILFEFSKIFNIFLDS